MAQDERTFAKTSAYLSRNSVVLKLATFAFCPVKVRLDTMPVGGAGAGAGTAALGEGGGGEASPNVTPVEFEVTGTPSSFTGTSLPPAQRSALMSMGPLLAPCQTAKV